MLARACTHPSEVEAQSYHATRCQCPGDGGNHTVVHGAPSQGVGMADHCRGPWALSFQEVQYTLEMDRMASCAGEPNRFELTLAIHRRKFLALGLAKVRDRDARASLTALTRPVRFHQRMIV